MAYSLHVVRRSGTPIYSTEWATVAEQARMEPLSIVRLTNPETGEVIEIQDGGSTTFFHPSGMTLQFKNGRISVPNPDDRQILLLKELATGLSAAVEGDEGEIY